jgi:acetyl-CoA C-acetyltransferase
VNLKGQAYIAGAYEHPTRKSPDKSCALLHAESAAGALRDAGLERGDVDGYFCAGDAPGLGPLSLCEYLGLRPRHVDSTDTGGSAPLLHVAHAAQAIAAGKCRVALITLAGVPRSQPAVHAAGVRSNANTPEYEFESPYRLNNPAAYAMAARRHMHQFGTTSEQLAWIKVAASQHARHNPQAMLRQPVTVAEVLASPPVADPLRKLDCCVVSDGGGAVLVVAPEVMQQLKRPAVRVLGCGESPKGTLDGDVDLSFTGAAWAGRAAFEEAGVKPADIDYASIYDSFTITVLLQLEDLGFCAKGEGGRFVADGGLISGAGRLAVNTDGGGLCNNHPSNRGGITKVIEAVRQLRGEAHPEVQVRDCRLALASGVGGNLATRHGAATLILERE